LSGYTEGEVFFVLNLLRPCVLPLIPFEKRLPQIRGVLGLFNVVELPDQPLEVLSFDNPVNMITTEELLAEGVRLGDIWLVIEDTVMYLLDPWLVLMRFPVFLQMRRGPWAVHWV